MNLQELRRHDWSVYTLAELERRYNQAHTDRRHARSRQSGNFYAALIATLAAEITARRAAAAA